VVANLVLHTKREEYRLRVFENSVLRKVQKDGRQIVEKVA
jgi:hypothetical protein